MGACLRTRHQETETAIKIFFSFWCIFHQSIIKPLQIHGSSFQSYDKQCISCVIHLVHLSFLNPSVISVELWWYRGYLAEEHYLPLPSRAATQKVTAEITTTCTTFPRTSQSCHGLEKADKLKEIFFLVFSFSFLSAFSFTSEVFLVSYQVLIIVSCSGGAGRDTHTSLEILHQKIWTGTCWRFIVLSTLSIKPADIHPENQEKAKGT